MDIQIYILINIYIFIYYFCNPFDNTMVIVLQFHLALRGSDNRENPDGYHDPLVSGGGALDNTALANHYVPISTAALALLTTCKNGT